jgi:hypothetical protein
MLKTIVKILLAVTMLLFFRNSFASETVDTVAQELFENKCSKCHTLERALTKTKDLQGWKKTAIRMSKYSAGEITLEEAEIIAEYLASCPPEDDEVK